MSATVHACPHDFSESSSVADLGSHVTTLSVESECTLPVDSATNMAATSRDPVMQGFRGVGTNMVVLYGDVIDVR